jgi:predicted metalloprotease with PDZ domain
MGSAPLAAADLDYSFRYTREPQPGLSVEVRFPGGPAGFTVLGWCLNPWPGFADCGRVVQGLAVHSQRTGEALALDRPEINIWTIDHPPGEPLVVRYEVAAPAGDASLSPFAPVVNGGSILFLGDTVLVVPEHLVSRPESEIHYEWQGPLPEGWAAASSFAVGGRQQVVRLPLKAFLQGLFFVGELSIDEAALPDGSPMRLVWLDREPPSPPVRRHVLSKLVPIRAAVSGYLGPAASAARTCFVVTTTAEGVAAMALTSSLLFLVEPGKLPGDIGRTATETITIAHELVHTFPAGRLRLAGGPVTDGFLPEALAEFVGRRALVRARLLAEEDWAAAVSEKLSKYARRMMDAGAEEESDSYVLGDLLLILIDAEIRHVSAGEKDLRALLAEVLGRAGDGVLLHREPWLDFRASLAALTSPAFVSRLDDLLLRRQRIELSDEMFDGCLRVTRTSLHEFDPGFDAERSIESRRVVAVREDGPAWEAGLRDGAELLEWYIPWGQPDVPIRLLVARQGENRTVSFLPRGEEIFFEQRVDPAGEGAGCVQVL